MFNANKSFRKTNEPQNHIEIYAEVDSICMLQKDKDDSDEEVIITLAPEQIDEVVTWLQEAKASLRTN